jgi:endonuclease/exonuclease/phosphatase family metal-dependent hydrolase
MDLILLTLLFSTLGMQAATQDRAVSPIRVMSFNIRFATANDGPNHWEHRHGAAAQAIARFDPDLLGTQETLASQRDFILERFPHFRAVAVGRDDGADAGEMSPVFYRADRFELIESGVFWLSPTPQVVASVGWDARITRIATWIRLRDLKAPESKSILWVNTHFDHVGSQARLESARMILAFVGERRGDHDVIVTGDFNTGEGSDPWVALTSDGLLRDTYRVVHPQRQPDEGTFTAFDPANNRGDRIDWILVSDAFSVLDAEIDQRLYDGRLPSDHFAVTATVSR